MLSPVMSILSGLFSMLLVALLLSGADKLWRAAAAASALLGARLVPGRTAARGRHARRMARFLGLGEVVIGAAAGLAVLQPPPADVAPALGALVVGLAFAAFAWFVHRIQAANPGGSCGCFGGGSTSGPLHLAANVGAAAVGLAVSARSILGAHDRQVRETLADPATAIPFVAVVLLASVMFLMVPSLVADLRRASEGSGGDVATFAISETIHR